MTSPDNVTCNECGASNWRSLHTDDYPERRKSRDRTKRTIYVCRECRAEGKHFEHGNNGSEQFTGAMRR